MAARRTLHWWLSNFVDWLKPDETAEERIRSQADEIRIRIGGQARADELTIRSTPRSGSFAKRTGLRRHLTGGSEVEGQDVDLPFVVSPHTKEGEKLTYLLDRFEQYTAASYPGTRRKRTKSSIQLDFSGSKLRYDVVPMLATSDPQKQILIREDGSHVATSVQQHIEFIRTRTRVSNELEGRVKFNECVRLVKWWREFRSSESGLEVPSFLLDLLCADAFDRRSVNEKYPETMAGWFAWMAHQVSNRQRVAFSDFTRIPAPKAVAWEVLDPVNQENNVASRFTLAQLDTLADWFDDARDRWNRILRHEALGNETGMKGELIALFGTPFKHHCEVSE